MIMVDSSVWIPYFRGAITRETDLLNQLLGKTVVAIGDLIYVEVLPGFNKDRHFNIAKKLLDSLVFCPMGGRDIALKSAHNSRYLRKKGVTIRKTIDVIIAT